MGLLFIGGCYKTESQPGSEICTAAKDGVCTECNTDNGLFKNPAAAPKSGSECILCWDTKGADGYTGVENCATCTAPASSPGAATCSTCQAGAYKSGSECKPCTLPCATCETEATRCTSCETGKYLKGNECVGPTECDNGNYADKKTWTCKACSEITGCTTCEYNPATGSPKCTACNGKIVKEEADGTTTCVEANGCARDGQAGTHFLSDNNDKCILCSDTTTGTGASNQGKDNCKTCTKAGSGQAPECSECLDGYFFEGNSCTATCAPNCATCAKKTESNQCNTCKPEFFLKSGAPGECVACDNETNGREGCSACSNNNGFKCTECKPNYRKQLNGDAGNDYTCVKTCEDPTACGGTSGSCDAIVIDNDGVEHHYCSYCGESGKFPIDGLCASEAKGNTGCVNNVCTSCTMGYFLYMGGCYSISAQPGKSMCTKAGEGVCTEAAAGYFIPPSPTKDKQSVLACSNPLGVELAGQKAYVGVDGCSACTAPAALTGAGMIPATCTVCTNNNKPNKDGSGCVLCSDTNCKSCTMDNICGECNSGFSLDNGRCVSSGANRSGLSTGAIAGISVAVVVVVGGLVGFLCWWFVCRGKA